MRSGAKTRQRERKIHPGGGGIANTEKGDGISRHRNGESYGDKRKSRKDGRVNDFSVVRNRSLKNESARVGVDAEASANSLALTPASSHPPSHPPPLKERISIGIACCRINNGKPEILIVCKRYTYAYNMFVHGRYNSGNNQEIIKMFNEMTVEEKSDIMSLNFTQIWYRIWSGSTQKMSNFVVSKSKFEYTFVADGGNRLRSLIAKAHNNAPKIWEIPKGKKKNKQESDIHCAVREFGEETGVIKNRYKIYPNTRTYSYVDQGVKYTNIYYIACVTHNFTPRVDFGNPVQLEEVSDVRFANVEELRILDPTGRLAKFVKPIFNFVKKNK